MVKLLITLAPLTLLWVRKVVQMVLVLLVTLSSVVVLETACSVLLPAAVRRPRRTPLLPMNLSTVSFPRGGVLLRSVVCGANEKVLREVSLCMGFTLA